MTIDTRDPAHGTRPMPQRAEAMRPAAAGRWIVAAQLAERRVATALAAHSVAALRISIGLVFLGFGALKFAPGASPAEALVMRTVETLSLGLVAGTPAVIGTAVLETFIGVTLLTGIWMRAGLVVLAGSMVGIMSPIVLVFGDLFPGLVPTLEAQYVLKDIVLVTAGAVVAARTMGVRQVVARGEPSRL